MVEWTGSSAHATGRGDIGKCICVTSHVGKGWAGESLHQEMSWRDLSLAQRAGLEN